MVGTTAAQVCVGREWERRDECACARMLGGSEGLWKREKKTEGKGKEESLEWCLKMNEKMGNPRVAA